MSILQNKMSLRLRIFISMILLVFTATLLILGSTYYQYRTESEQYNTYRQDRKETQLTKQINYLVNKLNLADNYENWNNYRQDFEEINKIHNVEYSIFTTEGKPLYYSFLPLEVISNNYSLDKDFSEMLISLEGGKITKENSSDVGKFQSSYTVLKDSFGNKYAILFFPYFQDVSFAEPSMEGCFAIFALGLPARSQMFCDVPFLFLGEPRSRTLMSPCLGPALAVPSHPAMPEQKDTRLRAKRANEHLQACVSPDKRVFARGARRGKKMVPSRRRRRRRRHARLCARSIVSRAEM